MTPHKQKFRHDPVNGVFGDCFRTCIACLLDLEPEQVPHFVSDSGADQRAQARVWLAGRGFSFFEIAFVGISLEQLLAYMAHANPGIHYTLSGISRTGVGHFVIAKDDAIVHDPSLTDAGIVGPFKDDDFYVGVVAKL